MALNVSRTGQIHSECISNGVKNIPAGAVFSRDEKKPFYIKNIGEDPVTLTVKLAGANEASSPTAFYPGWNVELVEEITAAVPEGATIQWGE